MILSRTTKLIIAIFASLAMVATIVIVLVPGFQQANAPSGDSFYPDGQVASVNGEAITQQQVYDAMFMQSGQQVVQQLITEKLIEQEAARLNISVDASEVDARLEETAVQFGGTESLRAMLNQSGMSMESYRENLHMNLLIEAMLADEIEITDDAVVGYFEENKTYFFEQEQVEARHILVKEQAIADDLVSQLNAGADFAALAEEHSIDEQTATNGGNLGYFGKGAMVPEFDEAAFAAEIGIITGPVETGYGFHIIEVLDRKAEQQRTLEDVRSEIEQILTQQQLQVLAGPWIQELQEQADIEQSLLMPLP